MHGFKYFLAWYIISKIINIILYHLYPAAQKMELCEKCIIAIQIILSVIIQGLSYKFKDFQQNKACIFVSM